jgi:hypothetical protein
MLAEVRPVVRVEDKVGVVHLAVPAEYVGSVRDKAVHPFQRAEPFAVLGIQVGDLTVREPGQVPDAGVLVRDVVLVERPGARDAHATELPVVYLGVVVRIVHGPEVDEREDRSPVG